MSDHRYRVAVAAHSYDLERFRGHDKQGAEVWEKLAYCRNRVALDSAIASRKLDPAMVDGLPAHHPDALRALTRFAAEGGKGRSLSDEHKAKMRAGRERRTMR
jgi:hypothetical protein